MKAQDRVRKVLSVVEQGGMAQFDKDSEFAKALYTVLALADELAEAADGFLGMTDELRYADKETSDAYDKAEEALRRWTHG